MDKKIIIFLIAILCLPISVFASDFETKAGFIIPEADYNNLRLIHSEPYIYTMSYDEYEYINSLGLLYDTVSTSETYVKTVYNKITNEAVNYEISEEEYNNVGYMPEAYSAYYDTNYKHLVLNLTKRIDGTAYVSLTNVWKKIPATRSFDVIGVRLGNLTIHHGSEIGKQIYKLNGEYQSISYSASGTNIKYLHNGFGISMNIVDSNITELTNDIGAILTIDAYPAVAQGSYQHSQSDVSLATSQNYTISAEGLGGVFKFIGNSGNTYDAMPGVRENILS